MLCSQIADKEHSHFPITMLRCVSEKGCKRRALLTRRSVRWALRSIPKDDWCQFHKNYIEKCCINFKCQHNDNNHKNIKIVKIPWFENTTDKWIYGLIEKRFFLSQTKPGGRANIERRRLLLAIFDWRNILGSQQRKTVNFSSHL